MTITIKTNVRGENFVDVDGKYAGNVPSDWSPEKTKKALSVANAYKAWEGDLADFPMVAQCGGDADVLAMAYDLIAA